MADLTPAELANLKIGLSATSDDEDLMRLQTYYLAHRPPDGPTWDQILVTSGYNPMNPEWQPLLNAIQNVVQDTSPTGACVYKIGDKTCCATTTQDVCVNQLFGHYGGDGTSCPGGPGCR
jgi:hypothetical protein